MAQKKISILGCGWLGLALGEHLVRQGYQVKGSTTSAEKQERLAAVGIAPYLLRLNPWVHGNEVADFFQSDVLFLNIPPGRRRPDVETFFVKQIKSLLKELHYGSIDFVVFASSTSVYPNLNTVVVEDDVGKAKLWSPTGRALLMAERYLLGDTHFDTTVLRFGGLYGYERQLGRFLSDRKEVKNGEASVNLVHRDDCIAVVEAIIRKDVRDEVFNVCSDEHPTRRTLYTSHAERLGLPSPVFADDGAPSFKIVDNSKLKERLDFRFRYPDPLDDAP
ncbi:MAG: SDR family oxidoreductase [Rhodothermales bacterium]